jgi:hypothetical protein
MTITKASCFMAVVAMSAPAFAADKAPAAPTPAAAPAAAAPAATSPLPGMPDMSRVGPMSRPVTKPDKKGVEALFKASEEAWKKGDVNAAADLVDFPVIMLSDDSKGVAKSFYATREQWVGMMTPAMSSMPKDAKMSAKHTPTFLSDTLVVSIEDNSYSAGKMKGKWKSFCVLNLKDGKWKFKEMSEAGWGDMAPPEVVMPAAAPGKAGAAPVAKTPATAAMPAPKK